MYHVQANGETFGAQIHPDADRLVTHLINAGALVARVLPCEGAGCARCAGETVEPCAEAIEFLVARANEGSLERGATAQECIDNGSSLGPETINAIRANQGGALGRYERKAVRA